MRSALLCCLLVACGDSPPPEPAPGCNPLIGDDCLSPFPSSFFQTDDGHVAIDDAVLPKPRHGNPFTAARLNRHDGISPATPFVLYFKDGVAEAELPTLAALDQSVLNTSHVQVIELATGKRVPVFAELDANAFEGQRKALIIHPMTRLAPATRYAIALVAMHDATGNSLAPAPFVALRDRRPLSNALAPLAATYEEIFAKLEEAGLPRVSLSLAWDITTASDADLTGHLVGMRDTALPMVPSLTWTITEMTDTPADPNRLREVVGTFQTPSFLVDDSLKGTLHEDANGNPTLRGLGTAPFVVDIPQCAATATGPLPVLVFGHGLFGNAKDELGTAYEKQVGNYLCMVQIGTDWLGLADYDFTTLANEVLPDFNKVHIVTDRLQQAHVNAQVLARLVLTRLKDDPALRVNGNPIIDATQVYYYGISDGGIQGGTFMALSEDVTRGVLNVPGAEWSLLMFRSQDFASLQALLGSVLPDPADQQVLLAMIQPEFDFVDPASFAPHLLANPLPSSPVKRILVQESVNDAQVSNVATRVLARTANLPGLDLEIPVFGIPAMTGPLDSAYTQWDVTPMPVPPPGNTPGEMDNGAHEAIRRLVALEAQLAAFLTPTGKVTQTCTGPCVCDLNAGTCEMAPGVD